MERIGVAPGTEIGGYRILGPLGQGGMGAVYRAVDGDGAVVALKLLHPHLGTDPDARERLRREVAHLQRVRHDGVARVLDAEIDSTEAFVVTELVDGQDLAAFVLAHGPLDAERLFRLAEQLRSALVVVHDAGVLHRDLTPGNVLVTDPEEVGAVLIDFGIAQAADDARVTSTGLVVGTPGYLSPELLEGAEPSAAGDWWGWAALLAFAATGRPPFGARPLQAVLARARSGEADLDGLDPRTTRALRSALAVDPDRRASPEDLVAELRLAAEGDTDPGGTTTQVLAPDGGTRVMPVGYGDAADDEGFDGDGDGPGYGPDGDAYDDDPDDGDAYDDADDAGDAYDDAGDLDADGLDPAEVLAVGPAEPPEPRRRAGTVLAIGAALLAAGAIRPGVALTVAVGLAVLVRSVALAVAGVHARRSRRGVGRADTTRAVLAWPWYLLRALVGVLPAALVAASLVVVVGGVGWWLVDTGRLVVAEPAPGQSAGELAGNASWVTPALLGLAVLTGLLAVWFGPMSRRTRMGARWTLGALAPGRSGAATAVLLVLAGAAVLVTLVVLGQPTVWWPLPGPPDLR